MTATAASQAAHAGICSAPCWAPARPLGDSAFPGKVGVHTPSTLNTVSKGTEENPKQQHYKLGEVKTKCCMQDTTSEAGEGKCMQIFLASSKDQPDWQSGSLCSFLLGFFCSSIRKSLLTSNGVRYCRIRSKTR